MTWKISYSDDLQAVVLTYSGIITGSDIKDAAKARINLGKEKGVTKFLIDTREILVDDSSTFDIYDIPSRVYQEQKVEHSVRIAVVLPESHEARRMVEFYENVSVNRGWKVKTFDDRDNAIEWLKQLPKI
jgi:hypothetical protein